MPSSATSFPRLKAAERRAIVLELRERGASYRQIAQTMHQQYPHRISSAYTERQVHTDVTIALQELRDKMAVSADHVRTLELNRLDKLMLTYYGKALSGDHKALDSVLKIQAREALYLGLDKVPQRPDVLTAETVLPMLDAIHRVWNDAALRVLAPAQLEQLLSAVQQGLDAMAQQQLVPPSPPEVPASPVAALPAPGSA